MICGVILWSFVFIIFNFNFGKWKNEFLCFSKNWWLIQFFEVRIISNLAIYKYIYIYGTLVVCRRKHLWLSHFSLHYLKLHQYLINFFNLSIKNLSFSQNMWYLYWQTIEVIIQYKQITKNHSSGIHFEILSNTGRILLRNLIFYAIKWDI